MKSNITHIPDIIKILEESFEPPLLQGMEFLLSSKIKDKFNNIIFIDDSRSIVIFFERLGTFKCQLHVYTLKKVRGREVKRFFKECLQEVKDNTSYYLFLTFVPEDNPAADLAVRLMGFKKVGEVKEREGIEMIYGLNREDI